MSRGTDSALHLHSTKRADSFDVAATPEAATGVVSSFLFGGISNEHVSTLTETSLVLSNFRIARRLMEL